VTRKSEDLVQGFRQVVVVVNYQNAFLHRRCPFRK
jgi:hypothetical protein